ncbi:hypothetical protein UT300007_27100 [Clostridium sp. CTA-7]
MINSNDFKEKWNTEIYPLIEYDGKRVNKLEIPLESKNFLIEAGLPESATPFLNFEIMSNGGLLTLKEKYNTDKYAEDTYIGFTGDGDIIAIENKSGVIITINHETFEKSYVNNSVPQLAESLLEYAEFVKRIKKSNGRRAYLNRDCAQEELESIKNKLILIDGKSIDNNSFWWNEMSLFE